jgi:hypothetical protein
MSWRKRPGALHGRCGWPLLRFLEGETLPWYGVRRTELANRPLICAQAFGEALALTGWSDSAATRSTSTASSNAKLTILIRLQNLRRTADPG